MIRRTDSRGFTIIEVVATGVISVVAFLALYIGIMYAEARLVRDYHYRVALMHASGELDIQTYWFYAYQTYHEPELNKQVTIDDPEIMNSNVVYGDMDFTYSAKEEIISETQVDYQIFLVTVSWEEPSLNYKVQRATLREDFYDKLKDDDEEDGGDE